LRLGGTDVASEAIQILRQFMNALPSGPIGDKKQVISLLADCWDDFDGSAETKMDRGKLCRMEDASWSTPLLSFLIERHGQTSRGSCMASLYRWDVDLDAMSADCSHFRDRMVGPRDEPMDTGALAATVAELVKMNRDDSRLKWFADRRKVTLQIGEIIPEQFSPAKTVEGRRRRFNPEMESAMDSIGWKRVSKRLHIYVLK
jgi:hypothetical protein